MTERGQPSVDGSPACPFVAFDDDRDARADRPDHRHRCFAESDPAPRALAHQEAYCLSSAFPVCPTFQAWARREAARAKPGSDAAGPAGGGAGTGTAAAGAAAAAAGGAAAAATAGTSVPDDGDARDRDAADDAGDAGRATGGDSAEEWTGPSTPADMPIESTPRRNPPRDWAAPPPWATGGSAGSAYPARSGGTAAGRDAAAAGGTPPFLTPRPGEGAGLAGSAADRLASGESIADAIPPVAPTSAAPPRRPADLPSSGPDPELAGLVGGAAGTGAGGRGGGTISEEERIAATYPPSTKSGRRPAVSSTRSDRERTQAPHREAVQHGGPSWERARRYEAYPTIKSGRGLPGLAGLPRIAIFAGALGIAAIALFFLPALLGVGGGGGGPSPTPEATSAVVTPTPEPTPEPAPTPQLYVIKEGDTLSKIAKSNGVTLDQLLAANKDTIKNPDRISVGDEIIIPVPVPEEVSGGETSPSP